MHGTAPASPISAPQPRRTVEDTATLHREYYRTRERSLLEPLVSIYTGFVRSIARRIPPVSGVALDDLIQVGYIGLLMAIERYDPSLGLAFTTFAYPTVRGEILRWLRDCSWEIKPPRDLRDVSLRVQKLQQQLTAELGRTPTEAELADLTGLPAEAVQQLLFVPHLRSSLSLEHLSGPGAGDQDPVLQFADPGLMAAELRLTVEGALRSLPLRDQRILRARFHEGASQAQVAALLGISQFHVSRLERRALRKMRALLQ